MNFRNFPLHVPYYRKWNIFFSDYKAVLVPNLYAEKEFCNIVMSQLHSRAPSTAVVAKTPAELMWKHCAWCLLRHVRANQSE